MLKNFNILLLTLVGLIVFGSCNNNTDHNQQNNTVNKSQIKEELEEVNRKLVLKEKEDIDDYIRQHGLEMVRTGTGLCYCIEKQGDTTLIKTGDIVSLDYVLQTLSGDVIYSSDKGGKLVFLVGCGGVEAGLEEAILHLHKNDEALIIIPSYLAHGLIGDGKRVPPRTTIVYKVKVIENQSNKKY